MDIQNLNINFYILHKTGHIRSDTNGGECDREFNSKEEWEKENERNRI